MRLPGMHGTIHGVPSVRAARDKACSQLSSLLVSACYSLEDDGESSPVRPCGSPPGLPGLRRPYRLRKRLRERQQGRSCFHNDRGRHRQTDHGHGALVHHDQAGRRTAGVRSHEAQGDPVLQWRFVSDLSSTTCCCFVLSSGTTSTEHRPHVSYAHHDVLCSATACRSWLAQGFRVLCVLLVGDAC